jgi:hypothetical protein
MVVSTIANSATSKRRVNLTLTAESDLPKNPANMSLNMTSINSSSHTPRLLVSTRFQRSRDGKSIKSVLTRSRLSSPSKRELLRRRSKRRKRLDDSRLRRRLKSVESRKKRKLFLKLSA